MAMPVTASSAPLRLNPLRSFGRFELRRLLGKSVAAMVWLAFDSRAGREVMLTLPRSQPADPAALQRWLGDVGQAARLAHPRLAPASEVGQQDGWPFVAVERSLGVTLGEWLEAHPQPAPLQSVGWVLDALDGLAFVHEAGFAHRDLQLHSMLVSEAGSLTVMAFGTAGPAQHSADASVLSRDRAVALASTRLREQREAAQRDLLCVGVLLHRLLCGESALDEPDTSRVIDRMTPLGRESVRLKWSTPHPVPDALRVIANRATSSQERQRYLHARTWLRALHGWRDAQAEGGAGPLGLVLDRLRTVGHLPALPGLGSRLGRLSAAAGQRTDELAGQLLHDMALSFELLRTANSAQVQGTQVAGGGPVLTVRRAISLVGIDGVRAAANTLRAWPGPLRPEGAAALQRALQKAAWSGRTAQALRPAGYDPEVVYIIALLQNLGRLLVQYHFTEESEQIRQLMQPAPAPLRTDKGDKLEKTVAPAELPGMGEDAASFAVLGVDIESVGLAVARHWGLGDEVLHMVRRLPAGKPVRKPDSDADLLRIAASAANEAVDAMGLGTPARVASALSDIAHRYARVLELSERDLRDALAGARTVVEPVADDLDAELAVAPAGSTAVAGPAAPTTTARFA